MAEPITWVGLDAHKESIEVARLVGEARGSDRWQIENTPRAIGRLARKLRRDAGDGEIRCCYEAGPLGFTLQRQLEDSGEGIVCEVIAPSLIPVKPGERVKTDRRDGLKLVTNLRAGTLTEVRAPSLAEEAVRDLCRCREDAQVDLLRARHRLGKFLLRRGRHWTQGRRAWTQEHRNWIKSLRFEQTADEISFQDYLTVVEQGEERIRRLDQAVKEAAQQEPYRTPVGWLRCFRGIDTVTAITITAEVHGIQRFNNARALMAYLGLTPSVHASGEKTKRGAITKTGNAHVRRVLIEAAWCQRLRPVVGPALRRRREGQPGWVIALADRAMHRLNRRHTKMLHENKPAGKIAVAVARELVGFVWATLRNGANHPIRT
jgi:transposase